MIRRLLADGDAEIFRELRLEALLRAPESFGSAYEVESLDPVERFAGRLESSEVFAAFQDDSAVGMAGWIADRGPKNRHKGRLVGVYVRPAARGKGVARRLCETVIEAARGEVEQLLLAVTTDNVSARKLYEDLGFVAFGLEKRARKVDGRYYDDLLMAKDLRPEMPV